MTPAAHTPASFRPAWRASGSRSISLDQPAILGILNVTPDSFSDGGAYPTPEVALHAAAEMVAQGAHGLDIGGESTRPGSARVDADEQARRVLPVIRLIRKDRAFERTVVSIDTTLASVARAALDAGADAINDVSAGTDDPEMLSLAASRGAGIILMHRLYRPERDSYSDRYAAPPDYGPAGAVAVVKQHLVDRRRAAVQAGVHADSIVLDPGLGFGKTVEQNLELIRGTRELAALGSPILSALSRKSFVARAGGLAADSDPRQRLAPTLALSVLHKRAGAAIFRVHDVRPHRAALAAAAAVTSGTLTASE